MKLRKTIRAKITNLTNIKGEILQREYDRYQEICQEVVKAIEKNPLPKKPYWLFKKPDRFSSYVWGAIRTVKNIKRRKPRAKIREQPLYLRNDTFKIVENKNKIANHWLKLPTKEMFGGIWLPLIIPKKYTLLLSNKICDSKIVKRKGNWYAHITIEKEVSNIQIPKNPQILAIDLGEKRIATSVEFVDGLVKNPKFYGKEVRGIRRHYSWLRKRLGNKKLLKVIKRIKNIEQRKVNDVLHKISRGIVDNAKELKNSVIVLGDLKGIGKSAKGKGKRFNRIVSNMPYYKLTQYITYKAEWEETPVIKINERGTSSHCYLCGKKGTRPTQSNFNCKCGLKDFNADLNGAINIAKRGFAGISGETGLSDSAHNFGAEVLQ